MGKNEIQQEKTLKFKKKTKKLSKRALKLEAKQNKFLFMQSLPPKRC